MMIIPFKYSLGLLLMGGWSHGGLFGTFCLHPPLWNREALQYFWDHRQFCHRLAYYWLFKQLAALIQALVSVYLQPIFIQWQREAWCPHFNLLHSMPCDLWRLRGFFLHRWRLGLHGHTASLSRWWPSLDGTLMWCLPLTMFVSFAHSPRLFSVWLESWWWQQWFLWSSNQLFWDLRLTLFRACSWSFCSLPWPSLHAIMP